MIVLSGKNETNEHELLLLCKTNSLTVPYVFVLGVVDVSMKYFDHHSVFDPPTQDHVNCPKYWWRNVLYINTLYPVEEMVNIEIDIDYMYVIRF